MNYLTSIKATWHKNQRKFDFCICIKYKNRTIRPSIVQNQKSYCTYECSTNSKIILYIQVQYIFKNRIVCLNTIYSQNPHSTFEYFAFRKFTLCDQVHCTISYQHYTIKCSVFSCQTLYDRV